MIDANAYYTACKLKKTRISAVSMKNFEYQAEKKAMPEKN